jgi:hypothetical protein
VGDLIFIVIVIFLIKKKKKPLQNPAPPHHSAHQGAWFLFGITQDSVGGIHL